MPSEFELIERYFSRATPQTTLGPVTIALC
jgi:hypothetical protein